MTWRDCGAFGGWWHVLIPTRGAMQCLYSNDHLLNYSIALSHITSMHHLFHTRSCLAQNIFVSYLFIFFT